MSLRDDALVVAWGICVFLMVPWLLYAIPSMMDRIVNGLMLQLIPFNVNAWDMVGLSLILITAGVLSVGVIYD